MKFDTTFQIEQTGP